MKKLIVILLTGVAVAGCLLLAYLIIQQPSELPEQPTKDSDLDNLRALGYLSEVHTEEDREGVVLFDTKRSFRGLNIFSSRTQEQAFLMDMDGSLLKKWDLKEIVKKVGHVELADNGDLLMISCDNGLYRVGWDSSLIWHLRQRTHHDLDFAEDGSLYVIACEPLRVEIEGKSYPILNDYIYHVSSNGEVIGELLSLFELVGDRISRRRWEAITRYLQRPPEQRKSKDNLQHGTDDVMLDTPYDVFHTNSVHIIDRELPGVCRKGDLLLSIRELNLLVIVAPDKPKLRWSYGPDEISRQHSATLLANNNILCFDNGKRRKASRVIEIDPLTKEIVWSYDGRPDMTFFSSFRGGAQRLPNGNTLITDSSNGRVVEVTGDGDEVWMYFTPKKGENKRESVFHVTRVWGKPEQALRRKAVMPVL